MKNEWQRYIPLWIKIGILLILVPLTFVYSIPWAIQHALHAEYSGIDLHAYWYAGHFFRQGVNPYVAIMYDPTPDYWIPGVPGSGDPDRQDYNRAPIPPVHYLDGMVADTQPIAQALIMPPAMAVPLAAILGLTAWFSWPSARVIWIVINLLLALIMPWLFFVSLPKWRSIFILDLLVVSFAFYNFYGVRHSIVVGQQSLVTLALLLGALFLMRRNWLLAGICLGVGLSKYSIALPFLLFVLYERQYRVFITSIVVQGLALLAMVPLESGSPLGTIGAYLKVMTVYSSQFGVHLAARFPEGSKVSLILNVVLFVIVTGLIVFWIVRQKRSSQDYNSESLKPLLLLGGITLLVFLTSYHRIHDTPLLIFYLVPVYLTLIRPETLQSGRYTKVVLSFLLAATIGLLIYPTIFGQASSLIGLPEQISVWLDLPENILTLNMLVMLGITLWLLYAKEGFATRIETKFNLSLSA